MTATTLLAANTGPRIGPIVISEIMYHAEGDTNGLLEFVEIYNPGPATENLSNWVFTNGVDYAFAPGASLAADKTLVLVSFDPVSQTTETADFLSHYGISPLVPLAGPFSGRLDNAGETLRLHRADSPPAEEPGFYPMLLEDEVGYNNTSPWPLGPDGGGDSLNRIQADLWGNDSSSWIAAAPSPGSFSATPLAGYAAWKISAFPFGAPAALREPLADPNGNGRLNIMEYALVLDPYGNSDNDIPDLTISSGPGLNQVSVQHRHRIGLTELNYIISVAMHPGGPWDLSEDLVSPPGAGQPLGDGIAELISREVELSGILSNNVGFLRLDIVEP